MIKCISVAHNARATQPPMAGEGASSEAEKMRIRASSLVKIRPKHYARDGQQTQRKPPKNRSTHEQHNQAKFFEWRAVNRHFGALWDIYKTQLPFANTPCAIETTPTDKSTHKPCVKASSTWRKKISKKVGEIKKNRLYCTHAREVMSEFLSH